MNNTHVMPAELTPEMEGVWRAAFLLHIHRRTRKFPKPAHMAESAEQVAYRALVKHVQGRS
jgi:hypothetical protein